MRRVVSCLRCTRLYPRGPTSHGYGIAYSVAAKTVGTNHVRRPRQLTRIAWSQQPRDSTATRLLRDFRRMLVALLLGLSHLIRVVHELTNAGDNGIHVRLGVGAAGVGPLENPCRTRER